MQRRKGGGLKADGAGDSTGRKSLRSSPVEQYQGSSLSTEPGVLLSSAGGHGPKYEHFKHKKKSRWLFSEAPTVLLSHIQALPRTISSTGQILGKSRTPCSLQVLPLSTS